MQTRKFDRLMTKLEEAGVEKWVLNDIIEIMHAVAIRASADGFSEGYEAAVKDEQPWNSPFKGSF